MGGKGKLLWLIHRLAPEFYKCFVDVFGGSGTVTLNHPIKPGCLEVYNDYNSNLSNLFCCVKNRPMALLLCQIGRIFEDQRPRPAVGPRVEVDSKLKRKIREKKIAMGHKPDDHEEQGQTM